jgi:hypothetical protein
MESSMLNMKVLNRNGLLYPMLVIAAVSVIVFSVFGVATMTGLLPRAVAMSRVHALNDINAPAWPVTGIARHSEPAWADCGVTDAPLGSRCGRAGSAE